MTTTNTRLVALAAAALVSVGLTACSSSSPTPAPTPGQATSVATSTGSPSEPAQTSTPAETTSDSGSGGSGQAADVLNKAKANALAATSAVFAGDVEQAGKKMTIDFKGTSDGKTSDISIEMEGSGKVRIISVPAGIYMQADAAFWKAQGAPTAVQNAGAKFIKAPASAASLATSLSLKNFLTQAFSSVDSSKVASDVGEETVNGVDCWVLTDNGGKEEGALYISKDKNEIVRFTGTTKSPGQIDFSKWSQPLDIKAPPAEQILKIS